MERKERVAIALAAVRRVGSGLNRPECVVTNAAGDIFTADWRGGIAHLKTDGTQALYRGDLPGAGAGAAERHRPAARRRVPDRRPR